MWAKIDDNMQHHPKVIAAGPIAELIQYRAIQYCCRFLTNGRLPTEAVPSLLTGLEPLARFETDWPARMVKARLWHPTTGGFLVHDFLKYNPSRRDVLRERKRKSQGGKTGANRRWHKPNQAMTPAMTHPMGHPIPDPIGSSMLPSRPLTTKAVSTTALSVPRGRTGGRTSGSPAPMSALVARIQAQIGDHRPTLEQDLAAREHTP